MVDTVSASDHIGLDYRINLRKLADTIKAAKSQLAKFHKDLASLSKKASVTITIHDKKAKAQVKQFTNAIQAQLDKTGRLQIKAITEPFAKIGGAVPRISKDYEKLHKLFGQSPALLGKMNASFKRVNNSIGEQALRMQNAGRNGIIYYKSANRIKLVQQELRGTLKATSIGFNNVALATKKAEATKTKAAAEKAYANKLKAETRAAEQLARAQAKIGKTMISPSAELRKMGITSAITTEQFRKMNFEVADHAKIADLTRQQIKELKNSMARSGKATAEQSHQFNRLNKRLEHSSYQVRKQTSAMGDARRAQERWGAGFKYMMLSQMAWITSGALIFSAISGITKALQGFLDFNQGLVDAAAITQATASGYERMEVAAMKAFKSSTMGAKEATDAIKILGQAGMDATDAAIALETIYKVTTATGGDTTSVVKFLTTAINVWKLSAEDAAKVGNILGAALNYSKLEVEDLGVTFNYVASMAKTVGMSITELAAIMAVMANAGIKASTIGTGLRGVMSKLISGSGKLDKELAKLEAKTGVKLTFEDISLSSNTLMESLEKLSKAGFDLKNIFTGLRRREAAALNVMLEQGVERFKMMTEALKDTTAIEVMFERSMKGMKNQLILTGHQIQAVLIDALKVSQPIIIGVAKSIQALVAAIQDLSNVLLVLGGVLATWSIVAKIAATETVVKLAAGFTATATTATAATTAIGLFGKALKFLSSHWILTGFAILIGGYTALKLAINATTKSTEEFISKKNQEIDDLRKLQVLMTDINRSDKEKLEILADYAKDYPVLLGLLDQQNVSLDKTLKLIKKEIGLYDKAKIAAWKQQRAVKEMLLTSMKARHWMMRFALVTGPTEEGKKVLKEEIALLTTKIDLLEKGAKGKKLIVDIPFEFTPKMKEALEKIRYDQATALEQARKDYVKELAVFNLAEDSKTKALKRQLEDRDRVGKEYQSAKEKLEGIKDVESKEYKAQEDITDDLKDGWEKRKEAYALSSEAMESLTRKYNDNVAEIYNESKAKILKIIEDSVKDREKVEEDAVKRTGKISKDYLKLKDDLAKKLIDTEEDGYEKRIKLWKREITTRKKQYADMLKAAEDYYDELMEKAEESPVFVTQAVQVLVLIKRIKELQATLGLLAEKTRPKKIDKEEELPVDPTDYARGILDGLKEFGKELANEYQTWKDLTKDVASSMYNTLSDVFFDSMMHELKSAEDYWRAFTTSIKHMIADAAAQWLMFQAVGGMKKDDWGLLGKAAITIGSAFTGGGGADIAGAGTAIPVTHDGGLIKKMHNGGLASNETLRILKNNEYVIKDSSVQSIGVAALNQANQTGRLPQAPPQQVIHKYYNYIYAIDSESMDLALRKRGTGAISDISLNANAYARMRRDPRAGRRY